MAIDLTNVSFDKIRKELGFPNQTNLSLNSAEDGGYVPINICSPYRPITPNPASLEEWRRYDHSLLCTATEFPGTICDTSAETCNSVFNITQANAALEIIPATGVSKNNDGVNDTWIILNINRFPSATIDVYVGTTIGGGDRIYTSTGSTYTSWDLVGNVGAYNGVNITSGIYWFDIQYNDGSARRIRTYLYIINAYADGFTTVNLYYGSTLAQACAMTSVAEYTISFPIQVGSVIQSVTSNGDKYLNVRSLYFRRTDNNTVYRTDANGWIDLITTC